MLLRSHARVCLCVLVLVFLFVCTECLCITDSLVVANLLPSYSISRNKNITKRKKGFALYEVKNL